MMALAAFAACLGGGFFLPWWWPAAVGMALGARSHGFTLGALCQSGLGAGAAWITVAAAFQIGNHGLLSGRVASLFHMPDGWFLVAISGIIGGMTAGLGFLSGTSLGNALRKASASPTPPDGSRP